MGNREIWPYSGMNENNQHRDQVNTDQQFKY